MMMMRWIKQAVPPVIQVTRLVSEPDSVDVRSKLRRFIHGTFMITSQVLGHLLYSHANQQETCNNFNSDV